MSTAKITHYDLRYRTVARYSANGELIAPAGEWVTIEGVEGTSATVEGLENGIIYEFQVRAVKASGARPWSDVDMATPAIEASIPYPRIKHVLFDQQEGLCNGCKGDFPSQILEVDHIIPLPLGGTTHLDNLQLLCSSCNRIKGSQPMEYLTARLSEMAR